MSGGLGDRCAARARRPVAARARLRPARRLQRAPERDDLSGRDQPGDQLHRAARGGRTDAAGGGRGGGAALAARGGRCRERRARPRQPRDAAPGADPAVAARRRARAPRPSRCGWRRSRWPSRTSGSWATGSTSWRCRSRPGSWSARCSRSRSPGLGLAVSSASATSRVSLAVCMLVLLALYVPTQFPVGATTGWAGELLQRFNPLTAGLHFLGRLVIDERGAVEELSWLAAPVAVRRRGRARDRDRRPPAFGSRGSANDGRGARPSRPSLAAVARAAPPAARAADGAAPDHRSTADRWPCGSGRPSRSRRPSRPGPPRPARSWPT